MDGELRNSNNAETGLLTYEEFKEKGRQESVVGRSRRV